MKKRTKRTNDVTISTFPKAILRNLSTKEHEHEIDQQQRADMLNLAEVVEQGKPLKKVERQLIANIIRAQAARIGKSKRGRGRPPQMDSGTVAMEFAMLVKLDNMTEERAIGVVANRHNASEEGVRKALAKHKNLIIRWLDRQLNT